MTSGVQNTTLSLMKPSTIPVRRLRSLQCHRETAFTPKMTAYIRADLITTRKRDWDNLIKMGITSHFYGVESMNHESALKSIGKGMDSGRIKEGLLEVDEYFRSAGFYKGHISLIDGLPHETIDTLRDTGKWLSEYWNQNSYHMNVLMIKDLERNTERLESQF